MMGSKAVMHREALTSVGISVSSCAQIMIMYTLLIKYESEQT